MADLEELKQKWKASATQTFEMFEKLATDTSLANP